MTADRPVPVAHPDNEPTDDEMVGGIMRCEVCGAGGCDTVHEAPVPVAHPDNRWTAVESPPGGATALLDDGTVAAVIYLPWGLALGQRIARRRALRWFRPWPLAAITGTGVTS